MSRIIRKIRYLLGHKCPRCYEGDLFMTGSFSFSKPFEMRPRCPKCGLNYFPEPGFYYGAMFTSYIITSFFSLGFIGVCILAFGLSVEASFGLLLLVIAIFFVWFFRTSRSTWIHLTKRYDPDAIRKHEAAGGDEEYPEYVGGNF